MSPWFWLAAAFVAWVMVCGTAWLGFVMRTRVKALAAADERKRYAIDRAAEVNRAMGAGVFGDEGRDGLSDAGEAYREMVAKKRQEIGRQTGSAVR